MAFFNVDNSVWANDPEQSDRQLCGCPIDMSVAKERWPDMPEPCQQQEQHQYQQEQHQQQELITITEDTYIGCISTQCAVPPYPACRYEGNQAAVDNVELDEASITRLAQNLMEHCPSGEYLLEADTSAQPAATEYGTLGGISQWSGGATEGGTVPEAYPMANYQDSAAATHHVEYYPRSEPAGPASYGYFHQVPPHGPSQPNYWNAIGNDGGYGAQMHYMPPNQCPPSLTNASLYPHPPGWNASGHPAYSNASYPEPPYMPSGANMGPTWPQQRN